MTEMGQILEMVEGLIRQPRTRERMMEVMGVSERTLKRRIAEARHLGVELSARRMEVNENGRLSGPYYWEVVNAEDLEPRLTYWLSFEKSGTLARPKALAEAARIDALTQGGKS